jgi:hypothetical protein
VVIDRQELGLQTREYWKSGDQILVREWLHEKLWAALPVTVVSDTPELIALYLSPGTIFMKPEGSKPTVKDQVEGRWSLASDSWYGEGSLWLSEPGVSFSVQLHWSKGRKTLGKWKINLEDPFRRTRFGFDHKDWLLDIVVSPDKSEWRWKDEDEVVEAVELGLMSQERARELRDDGERALAKLQANIAPFDREWEAWRPDAAWTAPRLPDGWDVM